MDIPPVEDWNTQSFTPLPELSWREFSQWILGRRSRHRIEGCSMQPLLQPGDEILYCPIQYCKTSPQIGEVVIIQHPDQPELLMIKRVVAMETHRYWLLGDNRNHSTDSRVFGWVNRRYLMGIVQCQFSSAEHPAR